MTTAARPGLFVSPREAGVILGCSDETVRQMIKQGELRAENRGRNYRIPVTEIEKRSGQRLSAPSEPGRKQELMSEYLKLQARMADVVAELVTL